MQALHDDVEAAIITDSERRRLREGFDAWLRRERLDFFVIGAACALVFVGLFVVIRLSLS